MRKQQDSTHHVKIYPLHHLIFYPVVIILLVISISSAWNDRANSLTWWMMAAGIFLIGWLSFMTRQHYALILQDRVVRLEMRFRYFALTGKRIEPLEARLGFARIAALRFASDNELDALVERTLSEDLSSSAIKKAIVSWSPDHMRV